MTPVYLYGCSLEGPSLPLTTCLEAKKLQAAPTILLLSPLALRISTAPCPPPGVGPEMKLFWLRLDFLAPDRSVLSD